MDGRVRPQPRADDGWLQSGEDLRHHVRAGIHRGLGFGLYVGEHPGFRFSVVLGAGIGLFWVATSLSTNYLFERRSARLILINGGYHVVRFTLTGVAFALLG